MKKISKKHIIILLLCFPLLFLGLVFPQQKEKVSAQIEEGVVCKKIIPIGEAANESLNLFSSVFEETQNMRKEIESELKTAKEVLNALGEEARNCNLSKCKAVCKNISPPLVLKLDFWFFTVKYPACLAICGDPQPCQGKPCPDIRPQVDTFQDRHQKLVGFYENINGLIGPVLAREKTKYITEDIKIRKDERTYEKYGTAADKITLIEWIRRKLEEARAEFRGCATPRSDWPKFSTEGLFIPKKSPISCKNVISLGYPVEWAEAKCQNFCNPDSSNYNEQKCIECLCGNIQNWLCCEEE